MQVRSVSKYVAYVFLGVVGIIITVVLLALSSVGVSVLVGIANKQPGISIENASGSFYTEVSLGKVRIDYPQIKITGDAVKLDIGLNCVFAGQACIDNISARKLELLLVETTDDPAPNEPLSDYIKLPLPAYLHRLTLGQVNIYTQKPNEQKQRLASVEVINVQASMHNTLVINDISLGKVNVVLPPASTNSQTSSNESVEEQALNWIATIKKAHYSPVTLPKIFIPLNVDLKRFSMTSLCVEKMAATCTQDTVLSANVMNQKVVASLVTKPQNQLASQLALQVQLDVANHFSHEIKFTASPNNKRSSANAEAIIATIKGNIGDVTVDIYSPKLSNKLLSVTAQVDLSDPMLPVNLVFSANRYQAQLSAWMGNEQLPISSVEANIKGDLQMYQFSAKASVDSQQASDITLAGSLSVNDKFFNLTELTTSGDLGKLNASLQTKLTQFDGIDGLSLISTLGFNKVQLKPLIPEVDSQLNGDISLKASMTTTQIWGDLNCQKVNGLLQGVNLSLQCNVGINKAGLVNVKAFTLTQGKNKLNGKGQFTLPSGLNAVALASSNQYTSTWAQDTRTALNIDINLADLTSMYKTAKGTVVGKVSVKGSVNKPNIVADISINKVQVDDIAITQAQLSAKIDIADDWQSNISLVANEIKQDTLLAEQISLSGNGNLLAHTLNLSLQHPDYSFNHFISGEAIINPQAWRWLGKWEKGEFTSAFDRFFLDKPTEIRVNQTRATIRPHCWVSARLSDEFATTVLANTAVPPKDTSKTLCLEQIRYSPALTEVNAKFAYNLNIPLLHYFPDIIKQGTSLPFSTDLALVYTSEKGAQLSAYTLMTQANLTTTKHKIELVAVVANSSLQDQVLKTNVFAGTKATGALGISSTLNLSPNSRAHKGQLQIDNFMLSPLQRFIPSVEKLGGAIAGSILFDGPLAEPQLNGVLQISDVDLVLNNYPYPITNFNQTITIANTKADIKGDFELGAGTADYTGTLTLFDGDKPFSFEGEINGAGMQLAFADNELLASPSLKLALEPNKFSLKGEVTIPNAQLKLDKLPESARTPSSDTIVIGKAPEPPLVPIDLDIDVRILIDPPKLKRVTVNALDLKASLGGDVRVQVRQTQNPVTKEFSPLETYVYGSVNILSGSYEAYGQNLQVQKGAIFFSGAPSLPQFDITAVRNPLNTADKVVAGIRISGNPAVPKVELFSQPAMAQARQLSYLLQGTDLNGGPGQAQDVMLVNMLVNFGVGNSENGVNRFGRALGFDSLNVQAAGQGTNTQVQVTGRISDNIQVTYGVGLFDQASEVILRYQLLPQMYLEAKSGATSAVDLFYEWTRGQ